MNIPNIKKLQQRASNNSFDIDFKDFIKLYKDYTKESYSFLVNDTTFHQIVIIKMSISEKIITIDNKIEQNKDQYNLDRQTAKLRRKR